jgi:hypothetical protein
MLVLAEGFEPPNSLLENSDAESCRAPRHSQGSGLLANNGVAPFSGSMLVGEIGQRLRDTQETLAVSQCVRALVKLVQPTLDEIA